jgi:hypothetical protein
MKKRMTGCFVLLLIVLIPLLSPVPVMADWVMTHEHTHHWSGESSVTVASICSADLNGDGSVEIVMLGSESVSSQWQATLRILNWDGSFFSLRASERWTTGAADTTARGVFCGDLNGDGTQEILTAVSSDQLELKVWRLGADPGTLTVEAEETWGSYGLRSLAVGDIDGDGMIEIVTGESQTSPSRFLVRIVQFDGASFSDEHIEIWEIDGEGGMVFGLAVGDVDADSEIELVTGVTANNQIHIQIWQWNGSTLSQEASEQWFALSRTNVMELSLGNLDADSFTEIAVAGTARDMSDLSHPLYGCLSIWQWDGTELQLEDHDTWQSSRGNIEYFGCQVVDVNSDDQNEIIVTGPFHEVIPENVLRVYNLTGSGLEVLFSEEWIADDMHHAYAYTVHASDVDNDRKIEIITGGRAVNPEDVQNQEITIWGVWFQVPAPGWLSWLEDILWFEGWPLYLTVRDLIPMPWPIIIYTGIFIGLVVLAAWGVTRLISRIRRRNRGPEHK